MSFRLLVVVLGTLAGAARLAAQSGPTLGTITAETVTVRGSPRPDGPDAGTLARGQTVVVVKPAGDKWLAVQPPRGSLSWVNHLHLDPPSDDSVYPRNQVASAETVKLAVGRQGYNRPLEVRLATVPAGTIFRVIGPKVDDPDGNSKWYPVEPPEDDFRYVPADAVQLAGPAPAAFVVKSPPQSTPSRPDPGPASIANGPGKPAGWPRHALWAKAEAAEQANDLDGAEKLYFQLAREMNAPNGDADLANLCYARVHALRERKRQGTAATTAADKPSAPRAELPARRDDPPARADDDDRGRWTGAGTLRRTGFKVGGQPAFALEDDRGRVMAYAVAAGGVDLERYVRKAVDLYGPVRDVPDLRGVGLVVVRRVDVLK